MVLRINTETSRTFTKINKSALPSFEFKLNSEITYEKMAAILMKMIKYPKALFILSILKIYSIDTYS